MKTKRFFWVMIALLIVSSLILSACGGKKETPTVVVDDDKPMVDEGPFLACQVTDTGGIDDKSFNATAWKGMTDAADTLDDVEVIYLESEQQQDYEANIQAFIEEECDLIMAVGFLLGDATAAAAAANPDTLFGIVDVNYLAADNLYGSGFAINEATFLAGYLAAGMTQTGVVATYGGMQIPPVRIPQNRKSQGRGSRPFGFAQGRFQQVVQRSSAL